MVRSLWQWLRSRFSGGERESDGSGDDGDGGFVPSELDASVLFAHGIQSEGEREVAEMQDHTRELEKAQRELGESARSAHRPGRAPRCDEAPGVS
jgi:hypothetical protein